MGIFDFIKSNKEFKEYHPNGNLSCKCYKNRSGELVDFFRFYNLEGKKMGEWHYKNGICDGIITTWYSNGKESSEGSIRVNRYVGKIKTWYYSGEIQSIVELKFDINEYNRIKNSNDPYLSINDPKYGVHGSIKPIWMGDGGIVIKSNVDEWGLWYSENGNSEEIKVHEIQKRNVEYVATLNNKNDETSLYCSEYFQKTNPEIGTGRKL